MSHPYSHFAARPFPIKNAHCELIGGLVAAWIAVVSLVGPCRVAAAQPAKAATPKTVAGQPDKYTAAVVKALRANITSPNDKLQVEVHPTSRAKDGYFSEIYVAGRPAQNKNLRMTDFALRARDVHINMPHLWQTGKIDTISSNTKLRAVISEGDLTQLLALGKATASMGLKVKYLRHPEWGDVMQVSGNWNMFLFSGPITGVGRLKLAPGSTVNLEILSLKLRGVESPQSLKNLFTTKLNPVLDYHDVPFQPKFNGLKVQGDKAVLTAD